MDPWEYNFQKAKRVIMSHKARSKGEIKCTKLDIAELLTNTTKCNMCGKYFYHENEKTIDHIIPVCVDGELSMENIQVLCVCCNSKKGAN